MAWWEWIIMLGLWGWVAADLALLRRWTHENLVLVNERRKEACHALEYDIRELKRGQRKF